MLSKRVQEKNEIKKEIDALNKRLVKFTDKRKQLLNKLQAKQNEVYEKRLTKINELNKILDKEVIITITKGGINNEYNEKLKLALKGSGMKYSIIGPKIINEYSPSELADIIHNSKYDELKRIFGVDKERSTDLIEALKDKNDIFELEILYCPDLIEFQLKIDKKDTNNKIQQVDYKRTEELSTGQRCTAVLPIVFAVSNNTLIIDQPEDNLDNQYIASKIHDIIKELKPRRQLIFITHNPNIPVLSDAEFNMFLTFENQKSFIKKDKGKGSIDDVKESILTLMEGGEDAFKKRQELYVPLFK